jgi:hypothetical protein
MDTADREPVPAERCLLDMTTRRNLLMLAGSGLALTAAGCRDTAPAAAAAPLTDVLLAETGRGLVRVAAGGEQVFGPAAVVSADGAHVYAARPDGLDRFDPVTGATAGSSAVGGGWLPRAVSADGRTCALARTAPQNRPSGRSHSPILVAANGGKREYRLAGVVEPDAFTADGTGLFVLEWMPASAPETYRVRLLDLAGGALSPLQTRDKRPVPAGAEEEMRGDTRQAVLSADRTRLFTLYTHQPGHQHTRDLLSGRPGNAHAFVHVLHLSERWAYCLDLPHPFGESPASAHALAADQRHLAVVDVQSGRLAYADVESLTIERIAALTPAAHQSVSMVLAPDGRTLIGAGDTLTALDRATDREVGRWTVRTPVNGLGLSPDGTRLHVGGPGRVTCLETSSGRKRGEVAVPDLIALKHVR